MWWEFHMTYCNFYIKTRMICNHLVICVCTNKRFEERTVFLRLIDAGVCSIFLYIGYLCRFDKAHYTYNMILSHYSCCVDHWCGWIHETCQGKGVCSVMNLEQVRSRGIWDPWGYFSMRLGVEVRKLYFRTCVYYFKYFSEMKFIESSDKEFMSYGLGVDSAHQVSFNCCLVILI